MATLLKALLHQRHLQTVSAFNREYDRLARQIDPAIIGCGPKKAQFYRWLSGDISGLPYPHHCRILQAMFPGQSVAELFEEYVDEPVVLEMPTQEARSRHGTADRHADVEQVFRNRTDFLADLPPHQLLAHARTIDALGISLNLLCQSLPDADILRMLGSGATIRSLFLDPAGANIKVREKEEGHRPGTLSNLTELNICALDRIRKKADPDMTGGIRIRTYDESPRFNLTIVDSELCVIQPYLPEARGVESPTFVSRKSEVDGVFDTFVSVYDNMWARGQEVGP
ncbi:hypothetical protein FEK35_15300 [Nocardia cyriacigeorgica]|uniref:DUF5919 domain-containing protein n=1 Tax=Nocardia cyriacigeorgica TaxID=135487 RepID=A0A5R8PCT4_9NOCA|nr:DUF5919 domain-containing protein [Nocardia cyriacigeorgica]TLG09485.1 hypothetical protein FEK35_15300 [Nocardia cyriacigeorgica]